MKALMICVAAFLGLEPAPVPGVDRVFRIGADLTAVYNPVAQRIKTTTLDPGILAHELAHYLQHRDYIARYPHGRKFNGAVAESEACAAADACAAGSPSLRPVSCER